MEVINITRYNYQQQLSGNIVNKILSFNNVASGTQWDITEILIYIEQHVPFYGYGSSVPLNNKVNTQDYIIIQFGQGSYFLDFSIVFRCNLIIRGQVNGSSQLIINRGMNEIWKNEKRLVYAWEWDDSFITAKGQKEDKVSVFMSDLTIKMAPGNTFKSNTPLILTKLVFANKVVFRNIRTEYENYVAHNLDLRDCSNVTIENCTFKAYNNTTEGAILAIRGNTENVAIRNNIFRKHGNDEMITLFGQSEQASATEDIKLECYKRNILIEGNQFNYDYVQEYSIVDTDRRYLFVKTIDVVLSLYDIDRAINNSYPLEHGHYNARCEIRDVAIRHNRFIAKCATVGTWIGLSFSEICTHSGIEIAENIFIQGASNDNTGNLTAKNYRYNFVIKDHSAIPSPIVIKNNKLLNSDPILCSYDGGSTFESENYFLNVNGGHIEVINNNILDNASRTTYHGVSFLRIGTENRQSTPLGTTIIIKGNNIKGLYTMGRLTDLIHPLIHMDVIDNYLEGDTRLYVDNTTTLDLAYIGNEFNVSNSTILVDQPFNGNVVFKSNTVNSELSGNIQLFNNYDFHQGAAVPLSVSFIEVSGNQFSHYSTTLLMNDMGKIETPSIQEIEGNTFS